MKLTWINKIFSVFRKRWDELWSLSDSNKKVEETIQNPDTGMEKDEN